MDSRFRGNDGLKENIHPSFVRSQAAPYNAAGIHLPRALVLCETAFHARGSFHSRTMNRSPSSTRSGSVPLCSRIPRMIVRGTPIPVCSI